MGLIYMSALWPLIGSLAVTSVTAPLRHRDSSSRNRDPTGSDTEYNLFWVYYTGSDLIVYIDKNPQTPAFYASNQLSLTPGPPPCCPTE